MNIKKTILVAAILGVASTVWSQGDPVKVKEGPTYYPFGEVGDTSRGLFGSDNRVDVTKVYGYTEYTNATLTMIDKKVMRGDNIYAWDLRTNLAKRFGHDKFDTSVKFLDQPTCGTCTGFLIAPDVMVTAGHCVEKMKDCEDYEWIFDYTERLYYNESKKYITVPSSKRYKCKEILATKFGDIKSGYDYAVLRLDRKTDRAPYRFRTSGKVTTLGNVYMIGSPTGLPLKLADNATVVNNDYSTFFVNDLDGFPGNSGGPVFNKHGFIEGIHVRGAIADQANSGKLSGDYFYDQESGLIKIVAFENADSNAGSQAHRITHIPSEVLNMAIYENIRYAIETNDEKRLRDWLIYKWIYNSDYVKEQKSLESIAAYKKNFTALELMLANGGNLSATDKEGNGLLHIAVINNQTELIDFLLKKGLSPSIKNKYGYTPLMRAVVTKNMDNLKKMVDRGGDVNLQNSVGNSALHIAVSNNNMEMVKYLIEKGANTKVENNKGLTPAQYAKSLGYKDIYKYLKKK